VKRILKIINAYKNFILNLQRNISHGRPRHRWEDNIKMGTGFISLRIRTSGGLL
jgi:hypothetical protein